MFCSCNVCSQQEQNAFFAYIHTTFFNVQCTKIYSTLIIAAIESKLAKVSSIIVFVFLVCWAPYLITRSVVVIMKIPLSTAVMSSAVWIVHASSFTNPIIYSSLRTDVQQALFKMFKRNKVHPHLAGPQSRSKTQGSSNCNKTQNTHVLARGTVLPVKDWGWKFRNKMADKKGHW